jgi:hypothetical protein
VQRTREAPDATARSAKTDARRRAHRSVAPRWMRQSAYPISTCYVASTRSGAGSWYLTGGVFGLSPNTGSEPGFGRSRTAGQLVVGGVELLRSDAHISPGAPSPGDSTEPAMSSTLGTSGSIRKWVLASARGRSVCHVP